MHALWKSRSWAVSRVGISQLRDSVESWVLVRAVSPVWRISDQPEQPRLKWLSVSKSGAIIFRLPVRKKTIQFIFHLFSSEILFSISTRHALFIWIKMGVIIKPKNIGFLSMNNLIEITGVINHSYSWNMSKNISWRYFHALVIYQSKASVFSRLCTSNIYHACFCAISSVSILTWFCVCPMNLRSRQLQWVTSR